MNGDIIDISYEDERFAETAPESLVRSHLEAILAALGKTPAEVSVSFVSDKTMQHLNGEYRKRDESTDILSFVQAEGTDEVPWPDDVDREGAAVLGDLVICPDALKRNARSFTVSEDEELFRLLVHGVLHLLGEDHRTNDADEPMLVHQEELLSKLGVSNVECSVERPFLQEEEPAGAG